MTQFQSDLMIPFAGGRGFFKGVVDGLGEWTDLWSSSPGGGYAWFFDMIPDGAGFTNDTRAYAYPVRCFKNEPLSPGPTTGQNVQVTFVANPSTFPDGEFS